MPITINPPVKRISYKRDGATLTPEYYKTSGDIVVLTAQNGVVNTDVQAEMEAIRAALAGQTTTKVVADIAARDALSVDTLHEGDLVWAVDATADATVGAGAACYIVQALSGTPKTATWAKVAEVESLDAYDVMHVASVPETMPAGLVDGGLLIVDVASA